MTAQTALVERYQGAVYRYLLGALADPDAADELFQEFALRLVRGDCQRAYPNRGRFRDFIKSSFINLMINYRKKRGRMLQCQAVERAVGSPEKFDADEEFLASWRKALLDLA